MFAGAEGGESAELKGTVKFFTLRNLRAMPLSFEDPHIVDHVLLSDASCN